MNIECLVNDALVFLGSVIFILYYHFRYKDKSEEALLRRPIFRNCKECRFYLLEVERMADENPQIVQGYKILKSAYVEGKEFVLGHNPKAPEPFVTWQAKGHSKDYENGHYKKTYKDALRDFNRRVFREMER